MKDFFEAFFAYGGGFIIAGLLLILTLDAAVLFRSEKIGEEIKRFAAQGMTVSAIIAGFALVLSVMYGGKAAAAADAAAGVVIIVIMAVPWVRIIHRIIKEKNEHKRGK